MIRITRKFSNESFENGLVSIITSRHFKDKKTELRKLFSKVAEYLFEQYNEQAPIEFGFGKSYIGFYRKDEHDNDSIFITIKVLKKELKAILKVDSKKIRKKYQLKGKKRKKDHGEFKFTTIDEFKSKKGAIDYSFKQSYMA